MDHGIEGIDWTRYQSIEWTIVSKLLNGPGIEGIEWTMVLKALNGPWY